MELGDEREPREHGDRHEYNNPHHIFICSPQLLYGVPEPHHLYQWPTRLSDLEKKKKYSKGKKKRVKKKKERKGKRKSSMNIVDNSRNNVLYNRYYYLNIVP